jgi:cell shape-determining protein MreC
MADTPTADEIAGSLRTRIEELRAELAQYSDLQDELERLEAALAQLEVREPEA